MATFELKMTRTHATQTKTESFRDGALQFEVPLRETVIATLNSDQDLFALETSELVALASAQLPPRTDAPQEGWLPWKACMLREDYQEVPPAPLQLPPGSPAALLMEEALTEYPRLFGTDAFAPYRVLEHWFCTIGNGLDWLKDGTLGDGQTPAERKKSREAYRTEPRPEPTAQEQEAHRLASWDRELCIGVPVPLYPVSPGYSHIFDLPENIEDSFLLGAMQMLIYFLSRPIWELHAYSARDLLTLRDGSGCPDFHQSDIWRHVTLADGAKYRALLNEAYSKMVLGTWGRRLKTLGFEDKGFHPLDYRLPPRAKSFDKAR